MIPSDPSGIPIGTVTQRRLFRMRAYGFPLKVGMSPESIAPIDSHVRLLWPNPIFVHGFLARFLDWNCLKCLKIQKIYQNQQIQLNLAAQTGQISPICPIYTC